MKKMPIFSWQIFSVQNYQYLIFFITFDWIKLQTSIIPFWNWQIITKISKERKKVFLRTEKYYHRKHTQKFAPNSRNCIGQKMKNFTWPTFDNFRCKYIFLASNITFSYHKNIFEKFQLILICQPVNVVPVFFTRSLLLSSRAKSRKCIFFIHFSYCSLYFNTPSP